MGILIQGRLLAGWLVRLLAALLFVAGLSAGPPAGGRRRASPERLKAVFIQNFATTTGWPANALGRAGDPFVVGLFEARALLDPLGEAFHGLRIQGHPVEIRTLKSAGEGRNCQLVFAGRCEAGTLREVCTAVAGKPILVVTEQPGALAAGSMLNFWQTAENSMRFEFGPEAMKAAGLEVSADVIELAQPQPATGGDR